MLRELQQQQALIESLLATQRALLEQRDSLSDELSGKMAQLWNDVSETPRKKKRGALDAEVDDFNSVVYRSSSATDVGEPVTYRSLGDIEIDDSDLGLGVEDEVGAAAAEHARECAVAADTTSTFRSAGVEAGAEPADEEAAWSLARRVELLMEIGRRLKETNDQFAATSADAVAASSALDSMGELRASLVALEAY